MSDVQQLLDMGFGRAQAEMVLREVDGDVEQALELLLSGDVPDPTEEQPVSELLPSLPNPAPTAGVPDRPAVSMPAGGGYLQAGQGQLLAPEAPPALQPPQPTGPEQPKPTQADQQEKALDMSIDEDFTPTPQMPRQPGVPCGLMNVGNTCYVNSLLQTLFHVDDFRQQMLSFRPPDDYNQEAAETDEGSKLRGKHALQLALELRQLFAYCFLSERSCANPANLLSELVDQHGQKLGVGSQEDVGEFMLKFLEQLEEGLKVGKSNSQPAKLSETEEGKDSAATGPLQALFFGQQLQIFSYMEQKKLPAEEKAAVEKDEEVTADAETEEVQLRKDDQTEQREAPANNDLVVSEETSDFLQIFLDVKHKNLYSAWEAANQQEVEYTTPGGSQAQGSTHVWIRRLPKLLIFQLQRVTFDHETYQQVKLDDEFDFDSTIYPDRFLHENREKAEAADVKAKSLKAKCQGLESALEEFENYRPAKPLKKADSDAGDNVNEKDEEEAALDISAAELLSTAAELLEANAAGLTSTEEALERWHPRQAVAEVPDSGLDETELETLKQVREALQQPGPMAQLLRGLGQICQSRQARLKRELNNLRRELEAVHAPLQKQPYELFAIWVHEGQRAEASSGHYVAYIKESGDRWVRFSDSHVSFLSWEQVRAAALGGRRSDGERPSSASMKKLKREDSAKSCSSAYVLVYMEATLAKMQEDAAGESQEQQNEQGLVPPDLLTEISEDNQVMKREQGTWNDQRAQRELQRHAQAVFQHYAGLVHKWDPLKKLGDGAGNPHDPVSRMTLNDPALMSFELYLYRHGGEQDVWHYLMQKSLGEIRVQRQWAEKDEGRMLYYLEATLREQECYSKMLVEQDPWKNTGEGKPKPSASSGSDRFEAFDMIQLDMECLQTNYGRILLQAHIVDIALGILRTRGGIGLPQSIGLLAFIWGRWNLDADYRFRQNEVLLVLSVLIYNTVDIIEKSRDVLAPALPGFREVCEYFFVLLQVFEWPLGWKRPLMERLRKIFPKCPEALHKAFLPVMQANVAKNLPPSQITKADQQQIVLKQPLTQLALDGKTAEDFEKTRPEPGQRFFEQHRSLWSWVMQNDKRVAQDWVLLKTAAATS